MRNLCYSVKYQSFKEICIHSNIKCHVFIKIYIYLTSNGKFPEFNQEYQCFYLWDLFYYNSSVFFSLKYRMIFWASNGTIESIDLCRKRICESVLLVTNLSLYFLRSVGIFCDSRINTDLPQIRLNIYVEFQVNRTGSFQDYECGKKNKFLFI